MIGPRPSPRRAKRARNAPDEDDGPQHAGLPEVRGGRAAGREDGLADEEGDEAQDLADDERDEADDR